MCSLPFLFCSVLNQCHDVNLSFLQQPRGSNLFSGTKNGTLFLTSYRVISISISTSTLIWLTLHLFSLKWREVNHSVSKCFKTFALWGFSCWRMMEENGWCFSIRPGCQNSLTLWIAFYVSTHGQIAFLFQSFFPLLGDLCDFTLSQWSHVFFYDAIWFDE